MVFVGIIMIIAGLVKLLAPDFSWELTELGNEWNGVESKRGEGWEMGNVLGGAMLLLIGIALLIGSVAS